MNTIGKSLDVLHIFSYFPYSLNWLKVTFAEKPWNISKSQKTSRPRRHLGSPHEFHRSATRPAVENSRCLKKKWRFIWRKTLVEFFLFTISLSLSLLVLLPLLYINIIHIYILYKSWTILRFLPNFCENNSGMTDD